MDRLPSGVTVEGQVASANVLHGSRSMAASLLETKKSRDAGRTFTTSLLSTLLCLLLLVPHPACASRSLVDETGHTVNVPDHPHRIICLIPSVTDAVFAIGAGDDVIAISDYVRYPEAAMKRPSVGSIMTPVAREDLSFHPDLVLGVPHANQQAILDKIQSLGIPVYLVDPHGLAGILHSIASLGQATHREPQAAAEVALLRQRIAAVRARVHGLPVVSVYMPIAYEPLMTIGRGSFITEIIEAAGGHSITADMPMEWPQISMEAIIARAPQALLLSRNADFDLDELAAKPGWNVLPAVRNRRVFFVDKRIDFPSPIAIDALEDLAKQFHP